MHENSVQCLREKLIKKIGHIESLDYDSHESRVNQNEKLKESDGTEWKLAIARWIFTILIGIVTGCIG